MKAKGRRAFNKTEIRKMKVDSALPEVKKLVSKLGLPIVSSCLTRLKEYEKRRKELDTMEQKLAELKKQI